MLGNYFGQGYPGEGYAGAPSTGATVALPVLTVALAAPAPTITLGATIALPLLTVTTAAPAPTVTGGAAPGSVTVALPALTVTLGAYTFTTTSSVRVGLPTLRVKLRSPVAYEAGAQRLTDTYSVALFAPDGVTKRASLHNARNVKWRDLFNGVGTATFEVPLDDTTTAQIEDLCIVRFYWYRNGVHVKTGACRIRSEVCQLAVDGRRWLRFEDQPGLLGLPGDGVIFPEFGYVGVEEVAQYYDNRTFSTLETLPDRTFGFMSGSNAPWQTVSDWRTPRGTVWGSGVHGHSPPEFKTVDTTAQWISATDPDTSQPSGAVNYFRGGFVTSGPQEIQINAAGDDYLDLWIDGEPVITADRTVHQQWRHNTQVNVRVSDGTHILAARVANAAWIPGHSNPIAFLCAVHLVDTHTGFRTTRLLHTSPSDFAGGSGLGVSDGTPEPGFSRSNVLTRLYKEAGERGVAGIGVMHLGFTDDDDSNGTAWTDRGEFTLPISTQNLTDVAIQLSESGEFDVWVDPSDCVLKAYKRMGSNLTGSVHLTLGDAGGSLKAWEAAQTGVRFTSVITQLASGAWVITDNDAGIASSGRIESGVTLGTVDTARSAAHVAGGLLNEAAAPLKTVTAQGALVAPIPGIDFDLGDTITGRNPRNSATMKVRCMAITYDFSVYPPQITPEFVEDRSV